MSLEARQRSVMETVSTGEGGIRGQDTGRQSDVLKVEEQSYDKG